MDNGVPVPRAIGETLSDCSADIVHASMSMPVLCTEGDCAACCGGAGLPMAMVERVGMYGGVRVLGRFDRLQEVSEEMQRHNCNDALCRLSTSSLFHSINVWAAK